MASHEPCCGPMFWVYVVSSFFLVIFAGIMSGLTLGLMSLELVDLEVLMKSGSPQDRQHAETIYPVVKEQHLLLCTLLICNALAMEALPIFLDAVVNAWGAILISVTLILLFGEILPQAVCSRYGLAIGAKMTPVVRVLVWLCFPISYPISKLLDTVLGKDHIALFRRAELKTLVGLHDKDAGKGGELTHDEATIITGALELTEKTAADAMTPLSKTFCININAKLDLGTMKSIISRGHSRVPVYYGRPTNIVGLILVKTLLTVRHEDAVPIANIPIRKIPKVAEKMPLYDILNEFQEGHSHMAVVVRHQPMKSESLKRKGSLDRRLSSRRFSRRAGSLKLTGSQVSVNIAELQQDYQQLCGPELGTPKTYAVDDIAGQQRRPRLDKNPDILDLSTLTSPTDEEAVGIITMEDVIEELLQEEIWDESDNQRELYNKLRAGLASPRGLRQTIATLEPTISDSLLSPLVRTSMQTATSSNSPPPSSSPSSSRTPTS